MGEGATPSQVKVQAQTNERMKYLEAKLEAATEKWAKYDETIEKMTAIIIKQNVSNYNIKIISVIKYSFQIIALI